MNTATLGFQWELGAIADACAKRGLGGIAPWRRDLVATPPETARRQIADAGLQVTSLCRGGFLVHHDSAQEAAVYDDNRRAVDEAVGLGAPVLCFVVGGLPEGSKSLAHARDQVVTMLRRLHAHAAGTGLRLAVEPLHPMYAADRSCISTLASALDVCDAIAPDVGVIVDAYHVWWDPDLERDLKRARPDRLLGWQICDWLIPTRDMLNDRGMMGDGVIDLAALDRLVTAAGYDGPIEVEIFSTDWGRRDPAETIRICAERFLAIR
ncbi:MAG: sugar phosphate isomerase/epimerase family protein [Geminicoccaceae bacterium]